jgi:hypothetical protein
MSQAFDHIVHDLDSISPQEKIALRELLKSQLAMAGANGASENAVSAFGWAKGRITIHRDFDAPLDDMKEYVE